MRIFPIIAFTIVLYVVLYKILTSQSFRELRNRVANNREASDSEKRQDQIARKYGIDVAELYHKAAEDFDKFAQCDYGDLFYYGEKVPQDYAEALKWYRKSSVQGCSRADFRLGNMYLIGKGVGQSYEMAFDKLNDAYSSESDPELQEQYSKKLLICKNELKEKYHKAAENGDAAAQYWMARSLERLADAETIFYFLSSAAKQNHPLACYCMGDVYLDGLLDQKKDCAEAFKWYEKSSDLGYDQATFRTAEMLFRGIGVNESKKSAIQRLQRLADKGFTNAELYLGRFYYLGNGVKVDYPKAVELARRAADKGNTEAMALLANAYYTGRGVHENEAKAVSLAMKAANNGAREALALLGHAYLNGFGVCKDITRSVEFTKKAADKGHAESIYRLGQFYEQGVYFSRNYSKAAEMYEKAASRGNKDAAASLKRIGKTIEIDNLKKAAEKGDAVAMYKVGVYYETGNGVNRSDSEAEKWFQMAYESGDREVSSAACDKILEIHRYRREREERIRKENARIAESIREEEEEEEERLRQLNQFYDDQRRWEEEEERIRQSEENNW